MVNSTALPFQTAIISQSNLTPNPSVGQLGDYLTFFNGIVPAASMVVGEYFEIVSPSSTTWSTYGTLQAAGVFGGNGVSGATGSVYLCTSLPTAGTPGTIDPAPIQLTSPILTNVAFLGMTAGATLATVVGQVQAINAALLALGLTSY